MPNIKNSTSCRTKVLFIFQNQKPRRNIPKCSFLPNIIYSKSNKDCNIEIQNVTLQDIGKWTCTGKNYSKQKATKIFNIILKEKGRTLTKILIVCVIILGCIVIFVLIIYVLKKHLLMLQSNFQENASEFTSNDYSFGKLKGLKYVQAQQVME